MSIPALVEEFYERIWNRGDLAAASDLLANDFWFRGSLGTEMHGHEAFKDYVRSVRGALTDYRCEILACVAEGNQAFAQMRFVGRHVGSFRGHPPTGKPVNPDIVISLARKPTTHRSEATVTIRVGASLVLR
jgi:SnoaL-like polyketide cyclase